MKSSACILLLSTAVVEAGSRSSASYSVQTESADAAGGSAASATYSNHSSAGGIAGVSTAPAPAETAKAGFIGQLYETTGLVVTAPQSTLNEGSNLQLSAWQELDDLTLNAIPAASVGWSVQSGPLAGISTAGLATAGAVYQNTAATARGIHLGFVDTLGLTVLNVGGDDFGTYSGDGLDDAWQVQHFGLDNPLAAPGQDQDADGFDNRFEYLAKLIPTDPFSVFLWRIEEVSGQPDHRRIIFSPRHPDRTYHLDASPSMTGASWSELTSISIFDDGLERAITDLDAGTDRRFYQIRILEP